KQFLWDDHDLVPGQRGADDRVRTGDVIGEAVAGHDVDATAVLFEMRDAVGLEQYLDVGMFAQFCARDRVRDAMLARFDLAEFQLRDSCVIYPPLERRTLQRIDIKLAAEICQRI